MIPGASAGRPLRDHITQADSIGGNAGEVGADAGAGAGSGGSSDSSETGENLTAGADET